MSAHASTSSGPSIHHRDTKAHPLTTTQQIALAITGILVVPVLLIIVGFAVSGWLALALFLAIGLTFLYVLVPNDWTFKGLMGGWAAVALVLVFVVLGYIAGINGPGHNPSAFWGIGAGSAARTIAKILGAILVIGAIAAAIAGNASRMFRLAKWIAIPAFVLGLVFIISPESFPTTRVELKAKIWRAFGWRLDPAVPRYSLTRQYVKYLAQADSLYRLATADSTSLPDRERYLLACEKMYREVTGLTGGITAFEKSRANNGLALCLQGQSRFAESLAPATKAVRLAEKFPEALLTLGIAQYHMGYYKESSYHLTTAIGLSLPRRTADDEVVVSKAASYDRALRVAGFPIDPKILTVAYPVP